MIDNPCYNCIKRSMGCHSRCVDYKTWKEQYDQNKEKYMQYMKNENDFTEAKKNALRKNRKRQRGGKR